MTENSIIVMSFDPKSNLNTNAILSNIFENDPGTLIYEDP
jgi:hypothetical protein